MSEQNKIDEIKEALAAAMSGPWELYEWTEGEGYAVYQSPVGMKTAITGWGSVLQTKENAHFIAKAPEYITYLLAEIEELKNAIDQPRANLLFNLHNERAKKEESIRQRDGLLAEIERQQGEIEFWKQGADNLKGNNMKLISVIHEKDEKAREAINIWETATPEDDFDDIMHAVIGELKDSLAL